MNIRSHYNYDNESQLREQGFSNSLTRPDESISLREMLDNYTSGYLPEGSELNGRYDDDFNEDWLDDDYVMDIGVDPITEQLQAKQMLSKKHEEITLDEVEDLSDERSVGTGSSAESNATSDEIARSGKETE